MKKYIRALKAILLAVVLYFVGKLFFQSLTEIGHHDVVFVPHYLCAAVIFNSVYLLSRGLLWHAITKANGIGIGFWQALYAWFTSLLGKYIPGKVFYLGARIYCYSAAGKSASRVTYAFFVEFVIDTIASILLFLAAFYFMPASRWSHYRPIGILLIAGLLIIVNPRLLNVILKVVGRFTKRQLPALFELSYLKIVALIVLGVVGKLLLGLGFFCLIRAAYALPFTYFLYVSGAFALASIIGILSVFAPSGIGVREAVLIAALSVVMPLSIASFLSVMARLWATGSELFWTSVVYLAEHIRRLRNKSH